jgi:hypothetical protein
MEDLRQLEIERPFCGDTQPRETARWDERDLGYITICQSCGKLFSGLTLVSTSNALNRQIFEPKARRVYRPVASISSNKDTMSVDAHPGQTLKKPTDVVLRVI